jgi:RNA polymerase sigma factor (sigma-70 family)
MAHYLRRRRGCRGETPKAARAITEHMTIRATPTDAELIWRARSDPDAFGELYLRHVGRVRRVVRARVPEALELDIVAETFAQAAVSLRRYRDPGDGSAAAWLCGIALNLLRRAFETQRIDTRARARLGLPAHAAELDVDAIATRLDARALREILASALADLPAGQQRAVALRIVRDLDYDDVARELGTTPVAARIRVMRALKSLSDALKGASA